jgi:hypothetical protein
MRALVTALLDRRALLGKVECVATVLICTKGWLEAAVEEEGSLGHAGLRVERE